MKFTDDFKVALSQLPNKEKDRLLWRLIKRDKLLARRLEFRLLEPYDAIDKRNQLAEYIQNKMTYFKEDNWRLSRVLAQSRGFSGDITRHVYVTNDKVGEITLNFVLLQEAINLLYKPPFRFSYRIAEKYMSYMMNKLYKTCILINKLHPDYHIEVENDAEKLGEIMQINPDFMKYVNAVKFNVNWLTDFDIPEDINDYYRMIKQQGVLK